MSEIYRVTKAAPPGIEPGKPNGQTKPQLCVIAHDVAEKTGAANSVESVSFRTIPPRSKNPGTGKGPISPSWGDGRRRGVPRHRLINTDCPVAFLRCDKCRGEHTLGRLIGRTHRRRTRNGGYFWRWPGEDWFPYSGAMPRCRGPKPQCQRCGGPVEETRYCYAIPTCYACLPPPPPLETVPIGRFLARSITIAPDWRARLPAGVTVDDVEADLAPRGAT